MFLLVMLLVNYSDMIRNVTYNDKEIKDEIRQEVGDSYSFFHRLKLGGTGSPRFVIVEASKDFNNFLELDNNINYCNIELRPEGIIVAFRSLLETFAWIVPYHMLVLYKSKGTVTVYAGEHFMRLQTLYKNKGDNNFIRKLLHLRSEHHTKKYEFIT